MATAKKKKGLSFRIGFVFGWLSTGYRKLEEPLLRWMIKKGMPATLASLLGGLVRLSLIGAFLCLALWVVAAIILALVIKDIIVSSFEIERKEAPVWMDAEKLFPDAYAPENIHDPAFHHDYDKR